MRLNEDIDAVALFGGEADETPHRDEPLLGIGGDPQHHHASYPSTWVMARYGGHYRGADLVAAPVYFAGNLSFGGLIGCWRVQSGDNSLRWFIDNFSAIAEWRATCVSPASAGGVKTDVLHTVESRIELARVRKARCISMISKSLRPMAAPC